MRGHASTVAAASGGGGPALTGWARGRVRANDPGHDEAPHIRGKVRGFALRWPLAGPGRVGRNGLGVPLLATAEQQGGLIRRARASRRAEREVARAGWRRTLPLPPEAAGSHDQKVRRSTILAAVVCVSVCERSGPRRTGSGSPVEGCALSRLTSSSDCRKGTPGRVPSTVPDAGRRSPGHSGRGTGSWTSIVGAENRAGRGPVFPSLADIGIPGVVQRDSWIWQTWRGYRETSGGWSRSLAGERSRPIVRAGDEKTIKGRPNERCRSRPSTPGCTAAAV